jgi:hypothetical protein
LRQEGIKGFFHKSGFPKSPASSPRSPRLPPGACCIRARSQSRAGSESSKTLGCSSASLARRKRPAKKRPTGHENFSIFQQEAHCWTRRYEQLREKVVADGDPIATDLRSLTVLTRQGLVGPMRAWHEPLRFSGIRSLRGPLLAGLSSCSRAPSSTN